MNAQLECTCEHTVFKKKKQLVKQKRLRLRIKRRETNR